MQKSKLAVLCLLAISAIIIVPNIAFADTGTSISAANVVIGQIPIIAAFQAGGLMWTMGGYFKNWRVHRLGIANGTVTQDPSTKKWSDGWVGFDRQALKDDALLGSGLGVIAFMVNAGTGNPIIINSIGSFAVAAWASLAAVASVDKYIIGGMFGK